MGTDKRPVKLKISDWAGIILILLGIAAIGIGFARFAAGVAP